MLFVLGSYQIIYYPKIVVFTNSMFEKSFLYFLYVFQERVHKKKNTNSNYMQ